MKFPVCTHLTCLILVPQRDLKIKPLKPTKYVGSSRQSSDKCWHDVRFDSLTKYKENILFVGNDATNMDNEACNDGFYHASYMYRCTTVLGCCYYQDLQCTYATESKLERQNTLRTFYYSVQKDVKEYLYLFPIYT